MSGRSTRRGARHLLIAATTLGLVAAPGCVMAKESAEKPLRQRKMFDFTPPRPGEMLANPAKGAGVPPQLKEFAPSAALHLTQNESDSPAESAEGRKAGDSGSKPRPDAAGPAVQLNNAQLQIGEQIAKSGIDEFVARPPQAASPQEQQYWESVRKQISASLATWQALYAGQEAKTKPQTAPAGSGSER